MPEARVREETAVSSDRLWRVVADFGNVGWIPGGEGVRTEGKGPGMVRIMGAGGNEIRERLESIDEADRTLVYTIPQGLPMPVTNYRATMKVHDRGAGRSELEWSCTFEPDGVTAAEAQAQLEGLYRMMIGWIRDHVGA